jgi:hypothetical protein
MNMRGPEGLIAATLNFFHAGRPASFAEPSMRRPVLPLGGAHGHTTQTQHETRQHQRGAQGASQDGTRDSGAQDSGTQDSGAQVGSRKHTRTQGTGARQAGQAAGCREHNGTPHSHEQEGDQSALEHHGAEEE